MGGLCSKQSHHNGLKPDDVVPQSTGPKKKAPVQPENGASTNNKNIIQGSTANISSSKAPANKESNKEQLDVESKDADAKPIRVLSSNALGLKKDVFIPTGQGHIDDHYKMCETVGWRNLKIQKKKLSFLAKKNDFEWRSVAK